MIDVKPTTQSDCEIIIHLYNQYGMKQTLQMLDGVFSFILCDSGTYNKYSKIYVARDPYGVRPLYILKPINTQNNVLDGLKSELFTNVHHFVEDSSRSPIRTAQEMLVKKIDPIYGFASELKVLTKFNDSLPNYTVEHFKPGTYSKFIMPFTVSPCWNIKKENVIYHAHGFSSILSESLCNEQKIYKNIRYYLTEAVKKRVIITERPIACLLSGGLDSSLITALVNECHKQYSCKPLETFSIGLDGSEDLKYARIVADYLGTNHSEVVLTEQDFIDAIPAVIYAVESYDTTTIRASIGNYLLGKYIAENSDAKVIFNGDGSDELCGGYLYMHAAPDALEFDKECRRLLKNIHAFDVLRSDKCISSHGLEPRTPFLDRTWVQYYLSIHPLLRYHPGNKQCEKHLLRSAFSEANYLDSQGSALLPECVLWRTKEAFSDGVSKTTRSLYEIIQESIALQSSSPIKNNAFQHNTPDTDEKYYYRNIFEKHYRGLENVVPYFWMPRYVEAKDASARTLTIYNNCASLNINK
jgi:asparagine synthase (glutamine-hydrolysing)